MKDDIFTLPSRQHVSVSPDDIAISESKTNNTVGQRRSMMRVTKNDIENLVRKTLKEQYSDVSAGRDFYAKKKEKLYRALVFLERALDDEAMAPGGGDPELEKIVDLLVELIDAVGTLE